MAKSIEGKFLVASPHLQEPNFFRTVAYIARHNPDEAFGLVINRPTSQSVRCIIEMVSTSKCVQDGPIFQGGPVDGPLVVLHDNQPLSGMDCSNGIYLSTSQDQILELVQDPNVRMRMFDGYSGWGPNQLDDELEQGGWLVIDATADDVFGCPEQLWQSLLHRVGREVIGVGICPDRFPSDPGVN